MKNFIINIPNLTMLLIFSIGISGCANNKIANTEILSQQAKEQAINSDLSPQEAFLNAAKSIEKSQNDQLHFYAPLHYNAAKDALSDAQDLLNQKAEKALILEQTFKVESLLKSAFKNKNTVLSTLSKSFEHKQILEELGSPNVLPEDFQDTVDDLQDLIKEIEGGFIDKALQGQAELLSLMTEVEINTLKKQHLSPVESMLDKASSIDADEYAEKTFAQAQQSLESATLFIEKNYKDRKGVRKNGLDALNAASHAFYIAQEAAQLVELKRADAEKKALYFESLLERINKSLGIENLFTMSLYDQSVKMAEKVESLQKNQTKDVISEPINNQSMPKEIIIDTSPIETPTSNTTESVLKTSEDHQDTQILNEAEPEIIELSAEKEVEPSAEEETFNAENHKQSEQDEKPEQEASAN